MGNHMVTQKVEVKDEMRVQMMAIRHMGGLYETTVEVCGECSPCLDKANIPYIQCHILDYKLQLSTDGLGSSGSSMNIGVTQRQFHFLLLTWCGTRIIMMELSLFTKLKLFLSGW